MHHQYDIIGDVHGQLDTLHTILLRLGYKPSSKSFIAPRGRMLVSVGDLINKGPKSLECLELMAKMVDANQALMVIGNHEINAIHYQDGLREKLAATTEQFSRTLAQIKDSPERWEQARQFILRTPTRLELDKGDLRIVHAHWPSAVFPWVIRPEMIGESGPGGKYFDELQQTVKGPEEPSAPYVDKNGVERTKDRIPWWQDYPANAPFIAFGHYCFPWRHRPEIPASPQLLGPGKNAVCLDFGAGIGDRLVALRYPEMEFVVEPVR